MRYIGNKEHLLPQIDNILLRNGVQGSTFFDFFAGTSNVGRFYKRKGYRIISSDLLYMSFCLQKAYIENNTEPLFSKLLPRLIQTEQTMLFNDTPLELVIQHLNRLDGKQGFIYQNYTPEGTSHLSLPRMYFNSKNGEKIDAIRQQIEAWYKENLLTEHEYFILLASLIESVSLFANVSGVYAAFAKKWDPRAIKPFNIKPISICTSAQKHLVFNKDSMSLIPSIAADIIYLDPPYNSRQYLPNYHILETIAKYDNPTVHGVTGMREYSETKSRFCNVNTALQDLEFIAQRAHYRFLVLSYNSEGIMPSEQIRHILSKYGTVILEQFRYTRFKSHNKGLSSSKKHVYEQIYILKRNNI